MRKKEFKPLLFTTTVRNPKRMKGLLYVLAKFNGEILNNVVAEKIMGELIKYGLYRPVKQTSEIKIKWRDTKKGEFSNTLLTDEEVLQMLKNNPQHHTEAGFERGWSSRFATVFDFSKELGFVYYWQNEKIEFSELGLKLANSVDVKLEEENIFVSDSHPEFEQQAFLHAMAKYQRNNPFVRVLNENVPLILLLQVIEKINADKDLNNAGISKMELPLLIFWKNNNAEELYKLIKDIRLKYRYSPSSEVIIDICVNKIMEGNFKKFKPKSIINEYPDEFIRKMRLTGLISLRGGGRFIDINKNEQKKVDYILKTYTSYAKYETEKEYFKYMADTDKNLISLESEPVNVKENNKNLTKWTAIYSWQKIKEELAILSKRDISKDDILKYLSGPIRLEFLISLAVKSKLPHINVIPNYPCDDEGIPTSTAGGVGDKGDIECYENNDGILIEVTLAEGRSQTVMEVWPITRHLEKFCEKINNSICYFIAPSIYKDSERQINFVNSEENVYILPKSIDEFIMYLDKADVLYQSK
ncbi:MAG: AlwI family type II restriction endonuclease [Patescibacteria group bacterium]|jgi:hypothetical protein